MRSKLSTLSFLLALVTLFVASAAAGASRADDLVSGPVGYRDHEAELRGYLVYDGKRQHKRPGVVLVPDEAGLIEVLKERADELARQGYVALVADVYGGGTRIDDPAEAYKRARLYTSDPILLTSRVAAAVRAISGHEFVEPSRIVATGFGFGGTAVLDLALTGFEISGVVSYYGSLDIMTDR